MLAVMRVSASHIQIDRLLLAMTFVSRSYWEPSLTTAWAVVEMLLGMATVPSLRLTPSSLVSSSRISTSLPSLVEFFFHHIRFSVVSLVLLGAITTVGLVPIGIVSKIVLFLVHPLLSITLLVVSVRRVRRALEPLQPNLLLLLLLLVATLMRIGVVVVNSRSLHPVAVVG